MTTKSQQERVIEGLHEIFNSQWKRSDDPSHHLTLTVHDTQGRPVIAYLTQRPAYCDRGHMMFQINSHLEIDQADSFPRYFFSQREADDHVRTFLAWRIWKQRRFPHKLNLDTNPPQPDIAFERPGQND